MSSAAYKEIQNYKVNGDKVIELGTIYVSPIQATYSIIKETEALGDTYYRFYNNDKTELLFITDFTGYCDITQTCS